MAQLSESIAAPMLPNTTDAGYKPKHRKVFEALLDEISSGRFRPGDRMPTEAELVKAFSASRTTISRAMRDLKRRGLLDRQRGAGTRLSQPKKSTARIGFFAPFASTVSGLGFIGGQIHAHLSELASKHSDDLRLQFAGRRRGTQLEQMLEGASGLIEKGFDGIFYYPAEVTAEYAHINQLVVDQLVAAGLPLVLVDRDLASFPQRSKYPLITYDNRRGGYLVADHIIKRGCKRVMFVGTPYVSSAASDRMRGYIDAMEDNGLAFDRSLIRHADFNGLNADFCKSLMKEVKPDAIICKMDHYAAVIGRHLVEMGIKIGRDVLLAGFDNEPIAEALPVPLTTVHFPIEPLVSVCYERLMKRIDDPSVFDPGVTLIDVELIVRGSTGLDKQ